MANWILNLAAASARILPAPLKRALYRIRPLARLVRGGLNRAAPRGIVVVEVAAGGLAGMRLGLDLQTEKDYWLGTYEPELQAALADWVRPGMLAYDVGANIGYISLLLARAVGEGGRVVAFEAVPENLERLRANLALNRLDQRVEVVPAAVVEAVHPVQFWIGPSSAMGKADGSAGRAARAGAGSIQLQGTSLDAFAFQEGRPLPDLVKMDIEGGEVLALPGMRRLLLEKRPLLFLELHGPESARAAWEILTGCGYRLRRMGSWSAPVEDVAELDWKAYVIGVVE